ncbi:hypothetical protein ACF1BN_22085 [Streptomyces sp. NPDC014861]|uniref:hypothetical protein n=1 Tax=Streptomyces sp. NPDC014861 TaxID=3364923 RepID=UPI0036FABF4A
MTEMTASAGHKPPNFRDPEQWHLTGDFIDSCLQSAGQSFREGELAYLAMTSLIENHVRDRVAYEMHRRLSGKRLDVGREWTGLDTRGENGKPARRAVDLAVVSKPIRRDPDRVPLPDGVVEFKAEYMHKARQPHQLNIIYRKVLQDVKKSLTWEHAIMGEVFSVMLLPSLRIVSNRLPHQIMQKIEDKVRYDDAMRRLGKFSDSGTVQEVAKRLAPLGSVREGLIDAGTECGVGVTVPYVILGPVSTETFENPPTLERLPRQRAQQGK